MDSPLLHVDLYLPKTVRLESVITALKGFDAVQVLEQVGAEDYSLVRLTAATSRAKCFADALQLATEVESLVCDKPTLRSSVRLRTGDGRSLGLEEDEILIAPRSARKKLARKAYNTLFLRCAELGFSSERIGNLLASRAARYPSPVGLRSRIARAKPSPHSESVQVRVNSIIKATIQRCFALGFSTKQLLNLIDDWEEDGAEGAAERELSKQPFRIRGLIPLAASAYWWHSRSTLANCGPWQDPYGVTLIDVEAGGEGHKLKIDIRIDAKHAYDYAWRLARQLDSLVEQHDASAFLAVVDNPPVRGVTHRIYHIGQEAARRDLASSFTEKYLKDLRELKVDRRLSHWLVAKVLAEHCSPSVPTPRRTAAGKIRRAESFPISPRDRLTRQFIASVRACDISTKDIPSLLLEVEQARS